MTGSRADIISRLQRDILPLQGFKPASTGYGENPGLGPIRFSFPKATFPLGAVHEFICAGSEDVSATAGFITGLLSTLMKNGAASIWISSSTCIFPPGLALFGIEPDKIVFIELRKEKDVLCDMRCKAKNVLNQCPGMRDEYFDKFLPLLLDFFDKHFSNNFITFIRRM